MANPKHVKVVQQGRKTIHAWREANRDRRLDFMNALLPLLSAKLHP